MELNFEQVRILAALMEKEVTTPDYYPLTLKSLCSACNQKSNRDPVVSFDEALVSHVLTQLRDLGLVWKVGGPGSRTDKFEQRLSESMGWDQQQAALMCELMLRGPQTIGELKNHASRMYPFSHMIQMETSLQKLQDHEKGPLVMQLEKRAGQKEARYAQLFMGEPEVVDEPIQMPIVGSLRPSTIELEKQVAELTERVEALEESLRMFRAQFD